MILGTACRWSRASGPQRAVLHLRRALPRASGVTPCLRTFEALCCPQSNACSARRCPGAALDPLYNGSKPIITSTGARTITRFVEVEEVAVDLMIDEAVDEVNLAELKLRLSSVYQLPLSAFTLFLTGGSAVVRALIAGVNGIHLDDIAAAVLAVEDATLSAAVGSSVTRIAPPTVLVRNVSREEEESCAPGYWCTAALTIEWCVARQ